MCVFKIHNLEFLKVLHMIPVHSLLGGFPGKLVPKSKSGLSSNPHQTHPARLLEMFGAHGGTEKGLYTAVGTMTPNAIFWKWGVYGI